jgi:hypothetical protein
MFDLFCCCKKDQSIDVIVEKRKSPNRLSTIDVRLTDPRISDLTDERDSFYSFETSAIQLRYPPSTNQQSRNSKPHQNQK